MNLNLDKKIVLITGSTRGIGFEIAKRFRQEGATTIINSRNKGWTTDDPVLNNSFYVEGDVTDINSCSRIIQEVISKYGRIDILVSNVGSGDSVRPGHETYEEWAKLLSINLLSNTSIIEKALPELKKTKGNIICISSICGIEILKGAPLVYSAAKAALNSYVKGLAKVIGTDGVRINAVAPGNINFKGSVWEKMSEANPMMVARMLNEDVALRRFGTPEEIADMVVFLGSSRSSFTTGSIVVVDGGHSS